MEQKSLLQYSMNYGLITGLILIVYSIVIYLIGQSLNQVLGYVAILILAGCIYYFTKQYRDKVRQGFIKYGQAFSFGLLIGVFTAILLAFFSYIEVTYIDPNLVEKQLDIMQQKMVEKGLSDSQIEMIIAQSREWMTPVKMFFMSILSFSFWSTIIALITASILKKNNIPSHPDDYIVNN